MSYDPYEEVSLCNNPYFIIFSGLIAGLFVSLVFGLHIGAPIAGLIISIVMNLTTCLLGIAIFIGPDAGLVYGIFACIGAGLGFELCRLISFILS